ncbi:MAG: carbamoyltransferase [Chloroflexi bacterium]|nr:carbamoyltransferase [Chloroflexota bacterium]
MNILGISCFYHDSAAALVQDGVLVAAAEEERFSRKKHDNGFPEHAIRFCLQQAGLRGEELDYVIFYDKPFLKFERILLTSLQTFPRSWGLFREAMTQWLLDRLWVKGIIRSKIGIRPHQILFTTHHMSHAASAFFCSPFDEAASLTADGVGEWTTATMGSARGGQVHLAKEMRFPHSIGLLYSAFTAFLGFEVNEGEYKVMGMAPYGQPRYTDRVYELLHLAEDGSFQVDMDYFAYHYSVTSPINGKFQRLFGPPRNSLERDKLDPYYADVAASIQRVTEEVLLKMANSLQKETGSMNLSMAGGVALNSVANGRILRETPFRHLYVQPAAGDGGGAVGAALYAACTLLEQPRRFVMEHAFWGEEHSPEAIRRTLDENSIAYECCPSDEERVETVVHALENGKVVGWMQGRFEFGPRALGNRSILADPRRPEMKDIVNRKIKFREAFRPFAPSVIAEAAEEYFDLPDAASSYPARFMLLVVPVKPEMRHLIPAVTHVDGSARLQVVHRETNPLYHRLIERFGERTGVPVLLNTSFNLKGEPIVNTPAEALSTFQRSETDMLVMGPYIVRK